jgi:hypothetical protein
MTAPIYFITDSDPEWRAMWALLTEHDGDLARRVAPAHWDPGYVGSGNGDPAREWRGESWQYMGTIPLSEIRPQCIAWVGPEYAHQFRHRAHPCTRAREIVNVASSIRWKPPAGAVDVAAAIERAIPAARATVAEIRRGLGMPPARPVEERAPRTPPPGSRYHGGRDE